MSTSAPPKQAKEASPPEQRHHDQVAPGSSLPHQLVDRRAASAALGRWQALADNSPQVRKLQAQAIQRQPALVQRSALSDQLTKQLDQLGMASLFASIDAHRVEYAADPDVANLINQRLAGNERWLGQQHLEYGGENNWPRHVQIDKQLRAIGAATSWPNVMALMVAATAAEFEHGMALLTPAHISNTLTMLSAASDPAFETYMGKMNREQTAAFLAAAVAADQATHSGLIARIKTSRILSVSNAWLADLRWRGGSGADTSDGYQISLTTSDHKRNDFAHWLRNGGAEPARDGTMNCWEAVMFMAYQSGLVSKQWLQDLHTAAAAAGRAVADEVDDEVDDEEEEEEDVELRDGYAELLAQRLGVNAAARWTYNPVPPGTPTIPAGNLIFMDGLDHVMLSKGSLDGNGRQRVYSMWVFPMSSGGEDDHGWMQDTTLEQVMQTSEETGARITYHPPPW